MTKDISTLPVWQQRFLAPATGFPHWASERPERAVVISSASGIRQAWTIDLSTGERRQVTDTPVGVTDARMRPDGTEVVWWLDDTGNEQGAWMVTPWAGGEPRRLMPDVADGWSEGIDQVVSGEAIGISHGDHDYRVYVQRDGGIAETAFTSRDYCRIGHEIIGTGGLSADASMLSVRHSEGGDLFALGIRVIDSGSLTTVADLHEPPFSFQPTAWSPTPGDQRLAVTHDRSGWTRPAIWEPQTGEMRDLPVSAPGTAWIVDWWPDASAVLVLVHHEMVTRLLRVDLASGEQSVVADPGGEITEAAVRPDGAVWLQHSSGIMPSQTVDPSGERVIAALEPTQPPGRPITSIFAMNGAGDRIQGFVMLPDGDGPFPTVVYSHGGPEGYENADADRYDTEWAAYADAGYAVVTTNYRGSDGYGTEFRNKTRDTPGEEGDRQTEDILAVLDAAIASGIADPDRLAFSGWSWGGFMGLYMAGRHPERNWRAVFSGVPAAELVSAHWECSPELRDIDRAFMGGNPDEVPERYAQTNPLTYVEAVRAPVLIIAGDNDIRCTIGQVLRWCEAFEGAGGDLTLYRFGTGHHSNESEETANQIGQVLDFFAKHLG